jgi:hypothetical protein
MIKKLLIVAFGLRACANLLENIRSDSEFAWPRQVLLAMGI